jgi:hypothetical protein
VKLARASCWLALRKGSAHYTIAQRRAITHRIAVQIGGGSQPRVVREWSASRPVKLYLRQPHPTRNFTRMTIAFFQDWTGQIQGWRNVKCTAPYGPWNTRRVLLSRNFLRALLHPMPLSGHWGGCCYFTDTWATYIFEACDLQIDMKSDVVSYVPLTIPIGNLPLKEKPKWR